jgi:hypothetical protein
VNVIPGPAIDIAFATKKKHSREDIRSVWAQQSYFNWMRDQVPPEHRRTKGSVYGGGEGGGEGVAFGVVRGWR